METEDFTPKSAHQYVRDLLHSIQPLQPIWQQQGQSATQWLEQQIQNGNIPQYASTDINRIVPKTDFADASAIKSNKTKIEGGGPQEKELSDKELLATPPSEFLSLSIKDKDRLVVLGMHQKSFNKFIKKERNAKRMFSYTLAEGYYNGTISGNEYTPYTFPKNHEFALAIKESKEYRQAMFTYFENEAKSRGPGIYDLNDSDVKTEDMVEFKYTPMMSDLGNALGGARAYPKKGKLTVFDDGNWQYTGEMSQKDNYTFSKGGWGRERHPNYKAGHKLEQGGVLKPFFHKEVWDEYMTSKENLNE